MFSKKNDRQKRRGDLFFFKANLPPTYCESYRIKYIDFTSKWVGLKYQALTLLRRPQLESIHLLLLPYVHLGQADLVDCRYPEADITSKNGIAINYFYIYIFIIFSELQNLVKRSTDFFLSSSVSAIQYQMFNLDCGLAHGEGGSTLTSQSTTCPHLPFPTWEITQLRIPTTVSSIPRFPPI